MQTILITGCSSGFGAEIARLFLQRDWRVIATMRTPDPHVLPTSPNLAVVPLDVTDPHSIERAVDAAGPLDVLVNNAGFGAAAPAELMPLDTLRALFDTNTFGTIALTQAVLPAMRARGAGVIVNVTSSVTLKPLPLLSAYRASKAAVNAYTESLAVELAPLGLRAHVVLPGRAPDTRFADNARARIHGFDHDAYAPLAQRMLAQLSDASSPVTFSRDVADAVWRAATDPGAPVRIPAGADALAWAAEAG